jgi:hypothetical protein
MHALAEIPVDTYLMSAPYALVSEPEATPADTWRGRRLVDWQDTLVSYKTPVVQPTVAAGRVVLDEAKATESAVVEEGDDPAAAAIESSLQRANTDRLSLLVRKYAEGKLSQEQDTRLEMATHLVRRLIRRTDAEGMEHLAGLLNESEQARAASAARRMRLGL